MNVWTPGIVRRISGAFAGVPTWSASAASDTSSEQVEYRSSGSFASAFCRTASICGGSAGQAAVRSGGGSLTWAKMTWRSPARENGGDAGQALEEDAAERVDVGPGVDVAGGDLLRRDVGDRADEALRAGEALGAHRVAGEAEVAEVRLLGLGGDEHVRRLDVAVDEPERVRGVERVGDRPEQTDGLRRVEAARRRVDELAEVVALDVPHRQVEVPALLAGRVDRDDVRVVEARCELRLDEEPLAEALVRRELGREHLDGHLALQVDVLAQVDGAHRAASEQTLDPEAGEHAPDLDLDRHG